MIHELKRKNGRIYFASRPKRECGNVCIFLQNVIATLSIALIIYLIASL